ncbi:MAG: hypothetical protein ABSB97_02325 [Thermoplasmata archaeon]
MAAGTTATGPAERRPNSGGTQRVVRLTLGYLVALTTLFVVFATVGRTAPGGTSPGAENALIIFAGIAVLVGALGAVLSLDPAPRAIEISVTGVVVVSRWGRRTAWPPLGETTVRVIRRYRAGPLSRIPLESVEVWASGHRPKVYLLEEGLLTPTRPAP